MFYPSRNVKSLAALAAGVLLYAGGAMAQTGKIDNDDASMLKDIAMANMAEIETGKVAAGKSADPQVKKFAQMMVTDHTKGLADVKKLVSAKGVDLPKGPDTMHKAALLEFKALRGKTFDSRYVKQSGIGDHEATEKLLVKTQSDAKDPDLKALAQKMLPVVQAHLNHAREMAVAQQ